MELRRSRYESRCVKPPKLGLRTAFTLPGEAANTAYRLKSNEAIRNPYPTVLEVLKQDGRVVEGAGRGRTIKDWKDHGKDVVGASETWMATGRTDIHSLNFPLVPAPVWELIWALNTIFSRDRRILIEGWEEGIWQLGPDDEQQLADKAGRVNLQAMKDEWGITEFAGGRDGIDALRARSYEPTANIQGLIAGDTGPGTKTIVPNEARARLDFRLIPNIQPADAIRKLKAHLVKHGFGHIEVKASDNAEPPYKISVTEDISQAIIAAATEVYGELPVVNGVSAEGAILRHVWIPCVLTGFANPGANLHAPEALR